MRRKINIVLTVIAVLIVVLVLPGLITGKVDIKTVTRINQPLSRVFITFGDPLKLPEWMKNFKKIEHVSGLPYTEGSKYRVTFISGHKQVTALEKIMKVDWKKRLTINMEMPDLDVTADLYFFQMDNYTEIQGSYIFTGKNLFSRLILPWIKPAITKKITNGMDRFRMMMENDFRGSMLNSAPVLYEEVFPATIQLVL